MSADQHQQRLDAAIRRRDAAQRFVQQLQGRLAVAQEDVASVEKECLDRGVSPDKLDAAIAQLERRYDTAISAFEADVSHVEKKLEPFKG